MIGHDSSSMRRSSPPIVIETGELQIKRSSFQGTEHRMAGISQANYFNWKKKYAGPLPDEMRRLKQLED